MQKFFVDENGKFLGSFDGPNGGYWDGQKWGPPPAGVTQVPTQPASALQVWTNGAWGPPPVVSKQSVIDAPTLAQVLITKGVISQTDINNAPTPTIGTSGGALSP